MLSVQVKACDVETQLTQRNLHLARIVVEAAEPRALTENEVVRVCTCRTAARGNEEVSRVSFRGTPQRQVVRAEASSRPSHESREDRCQVALSYVAQTLKWPTVPR